MAQKSKPKQQKRTETQKKKTGDTGDTSEASIDIASLEVCLPEAFVSKFVSLGFFGLMITK